MIVKTTTLINLNMKTKILILGMALSLVTLGCNKDDDDNPSSNNPINQNDVKANAEVDDISDDVLEIAETQSNEEVGGRGAGGATFLGSCAAIATVQNDGMWIRTIDFGDTNCQIWNGNFVRGKLILTFSDDFAANTRTISYAFDNFYHNNRHVEGNRTVVKRILENGHPQATISLDLTVTTQTGVIYTRTGERVREFTAGYSTPFNLLDNEFTYTGSWTTTNSATGNTYTSTITAPVIVKWNCIHYLVSGEITYVRTGDGATAVLDYGDGTCDDDATVTINGVVYDINF